MQLRLGSPVHCTDGVVGELADFVIEPKARRVTHLVVQPSAHHAELGTRLVPFELVAPGDGASHATLRCTRQQFRELPAAKQLVYRQRDAGAGEESGWEVGVTETLPPPFPGPAGLGSVPYPTDAAITYDRIPSGEVEIRRSSPVASSDGHDLGSVDGFVLDERRALTHLLLARGLLWARRDVSIPIDAVSRIETDGVTIGLTRDAVKALPALRVRHR